MAILKFDTTEGREVVINVRRESTVLLFNHDMSFTFDYEGRLIGAYLNNRNYHRSLDNEILEKQNGSVSGLSARIRRLLGPAEVNALESRAYDLARNLSRELRAGVTLRAHSPAGTASAAVDEARAALVRVGRYCYTGLERERALFKQIYQPVTILPPDQYLALYLQATEGCVYNRCTFCGFYRDRHYRVKPLEEFREHIRRVRAFLGGGMSYRRSIFLGDANALFLPQAALRLRFEAIHREFEILPRGLDTPARHAWEAAHPIHFNGIYSFVDAFAGRHKRARDFAELAECGLRRVYIGLESGDPSLLKFLGKPNAPEDIVETVDHIKAGNVAVGIIILVGAGGEKYQDAHIRATTELINTLPLDDDDFVYFSELVDYPGSTYSEQAMAAGIRPLRLGEIEQQMVRMRAAFQFREPERAPVVSYYDVREFVY